MRMAVPLPPPFLQFPGVLTLPFSMWLQMFENYLLVIRAEGDKWPDTRIKVHSSASSVLAVSSPTEPVFGCVKNFVHKVKLRDDISPVQQRLRRLPFSVRDAVSAELKTLQAAGIIEKIDASPWVSPIVVTQKKSGGIRMCVDLREPNKAVVVDSYPLPQTEELFSQLRGSTMFSTIDLANAYHQVPLHEDSRDRTAFITHDGLFRYK
ncbi:uncharacterized protein K02A2.6-like [Pygocentrus nattereri]|uniref:uncharacterized protein K02A2.6-like n=1 Tax=Pygocentrus nattereri TaxID=42514 RepID=UPI0018915CF2|nr:uncharacterized protein K02A2.6-like [Pygocentrus nattereri]